MPVTKQKFGSLNGEDVYLYTLGNANGLTAEITNYGGIIRRLIYEGTDVVLGRETLEAYFNNDGYLGALIGRNSNRIENSQFELNGITYRLNKNDGENNLHGGTAGFDKKLWTAEISDGEEPSLLLSLFSPDGEEGFPGAVDVRVKYTVTKDDSIKIEYSGEADKDTLLNMTNHSYFNLNGHSSGTICGHTLWLNSSFYNPTTPECIPTGEILSVKNTPFDFTSETCLNESLKSEHIQIKNANGIDHNFALSGSGYRKAARLKGDKTGIVMEVYTDQSGVQIYSGNMLSGSLGLKDGTVYSAHYGICLETQAFPCFPKYSHFPGAVLRKGDKYNTVTEYKFLSDS